MEFKMNKKLTKFVNCKILRNHKLVDDYLWVLDGKIIDPEIVFYDWKKAADEVIDLNGGIVCPGFIDIQINGGYGLDFSRDLISNPSGLEMVASGLIKHGVTSFCPTLVTSQPDTYHRVLKYLEPKKGGHLGAEVLGAHLEGPFINKIKKGAHEPDYIADFIQGPKSVAEMYGNLDNVKMVTLAPEKNNSLEVIRWLTEKNIVVSLGHSAADTETGVTAIKNGAKLITHLFNAMLPFHHRNPGLIGLLGIKFEQTVFYGIIADGIHTHSSTLKIAYKTHPKGIILVTDAISAMGLENGVHYIGDKQIEISGNEAYIAGTKTLCGSIATMDKCIRNFIQATDCEIEEALEAASLHPAQVLGIDKKKGTLAYGSDADFVVLNEAVFVIATYIAGECVYLNEDI